MKFIAVFLFIAFNSTSIFSDTLFVPTDFATIQDAVDAANNGDTVHLLEGDFVERIDLTGKQITLKGTINQKTGEHLSRIIPDASAAAYGAIRLNSNTLCTIEDLVITGVYTGSSSYISGGVYCYSSATEFNNCIFDSCVGTNGGAVYIYGSGAAGFNLQFTIGNCKPAYLCPACRN